MDRYARSTAFSKVNWEFAANNFALSNNLSGIWLRYNSLIIELVGHLDPKSDEFRFVNFFSPSARHSITLDDL